MMSDSPQQSDNLEDVDREIRIERMKQELNEISGGEMIYGSLSPIPPAMEEAFLEQVLAYERAEFDSSFNRLANRGLVLPPAAELDDATITSKLWEIIRELAKVRSFIEDTDHLSDRDLYHWLWTDGLRDESPDPLAMQIGAWHTSPIGSGSEEDTAIWLKYYADEEARKRWLLDFPNYIMPEHERLPYDRDRHLPIAPPF